MFQQDTKYCFSAHIGEHGVSHARIDALLAALAEPLEQLRSGHWQDAAPMLRTAACDKDCQPLLELAADIRTKFRHIVVAGAGGSGLSGRTLTLLQPPGATPYFHFLENIDPDTMDGLLTHLELRETCFLIISKSGTTVETLSQMYVLISHIKSILGASALARQIVLITMPGNNPMRDAAAEYGFTVLDHPADVGGRYSIFTSVGLLPAAIAGLDIKALKRGAAGMVEHLRQAKTPGDCTAALGAAIQYAAIENGQNISVMLPYCERLSGFSSWYRQNWAESLGKNHLASTPIRAVGTTDQHSQLQLYLAGPKDKLFHLILLDRAGTGQAIELPANSTLDYLRNKTTGDIMAAEQKATLESLINNRCPVRVFRIGRLNEEELGALLMHFMLEIMLASRLLKVDPFDQPAVEEGKRLARDYLLTGNL